MKKGFWISLIAGTAAVAGAAVAVAALIRNKTEMIAEELDFEPDDDYFEIPYEETEEVAEEITEAAEEGEIAVSTEEEPIEVPVEEDPVEVIAE